MTHCWDAVRSLQHRPLSNAKASNPRRHALYCCSQLYYTAECCTYYWGVTVHLWTDAIMRLLYFVSFKSIGHTEHQQPGQRSRTVRGSKPGRNTRFFSSTIFRSTVGPTSTYWTDTSFGVVKRPGRDSDHSSKTCVEVKEWSYQYNTSTYLHGLCRDNITFFTFTFKHT